jgi:hypothetical protein
MQEFREKLCVNRQWLQARDNALDICLSNQMHEWLQGCTNTSVLLLCFVVAVYVYQSSYNVEELIQYISLQQKCIFVYIRNDFCVPTS